MTELEKLIAQRNELDRKIKELQNPKYEVDGASLTRVRDYWVVRLQEIKNRKCDKDRSWQYKQIVIADNKDDAIDGIWILAETLKSLYDEVTGAQHE